MTAQAPAQAPALPSGLTTVLEVFAGTLAWRGADWPFLDFSGQTYTLGWLDAQSSRLAWGLKQAGARRGECVTSVLDNAVEQFLLLMACSKIGAIHVPLNTAYKGEYLRHQVADSGAAVLIAEKEYVDRILDIEEGLPEAKVLFVKGEMTARRGKALSVRPLADALAEAPGDLGDPARPSDLGMLIYTAGTTGASKGCMASQNYVCNMARQIVENMLYVPEDVVWSPLPGFHMNQYTATVLPALMVGARAAIYPRFSVSNFWPELERTGATVTQILSSMIALIADAPDCEAGQRYKGKLRVAGGTPFPKPLQDKWNARFAPQYIGHIGFGLTECAIVTSTRVDAVRPAETSGRRNDDFEIRIVDDEDAELPPGQSGEIIVRPSKPHVMFEGYWRNPEASQRLMKNLWFHTGDIGRFDEEGWFYFVDRKKDYLRRRGENISSMEVEGVFRRHPAIAEVAVHAVLADMEDDVKATCTLHEGASVDEAELCRWSIDNLPYFAVPRFIEFRAELPKNPVGRVLKYELREQGITATTWDREKSDVQLVKR